MDEKKRTKQNQKCFHFFYTEKWLVNKKQHETIQKKLNHKAHHKSGLCSEFNKQIKTIKKIIIPESYIRTIFSFMYYEQQKKKIIQK